MVLNSKIKVDWLVDIGSCYSMSPFESNKPPSELDFGFCVVLVLIIPRLTLSEIATISSDRQEQRNVRHLKSAQRCFGSGRENESKDVNYKATYFLHEFPKAD